MCLPVPPPPLPLRAPPLAPPPPPGAAPPSHWSGRREGDGGHPQREGTGGTGDRWRLGTGTSHGGATGGTRSSGGPPGPAFFSRGGAGQGAGGALRLRPRQRDVGRGGGGRPDLGPEGVRAVGPGGELRRRGHRRQDLQQQEGQGARAGGLPEGHQREPGGDLQRHPLERPTDEPEQTRPRRPPRLGGQHGQRGRLRGAGGSSRLLGLQRRHRGHDAPHRPRPGAAGHPRGHRRAGVVLHPVAGRFAGKSAEFFGSTSAFSLSFGTPGGVRPPRPGLGGEPHGQRGGGEVGRGPPHAALNSLFFFLGGGVGGTPKPPNFGVGRPSSPPPSPPHPPVTERSVGWGTWGHLREL